MVYVGAKQCLSVRCAKAKLSERCCEVSRKGDMIASWTSESADNPGKDLPPSQQSKKVWQMLALTSAPRSGLSACCHAGGAHRELRSLRRSARLRAAWGLDVMMTDAREP